MKEQIKKLLASIAYALYERGILKNHIHVHTIDETIEALTNTNNSLIRFGEGEIIMIEGLATATQSSNAELGSRLREILRLPEDYTPQNTNMPNQTSCDNDAKLLISVYDIFEGLDHVRPQNRDFWRKHLLRSRKTYDANMDHNRKYYNTFLTRCYYSFADKSRCKEWFEGIKNIWADKDIILVEGEASHVGVGNDLLSRANSVRRILCPSTDAYTHYNNILSVCLKVADNRNVLFLLALGATAKPLALDLFDNGYRVIDIGNVDLEYEWFLAGVTEKVDLPKQRVIGREANIRAGYTEYVEQIVKRVI